MDSSMFQHFVSEMSEFEKRCPRPSGDGDVFSDITRYVYEIMPYIIHAMHLGRIRGEMMTRMLPNIARLIHLRLVNALVGGDVLYKELLTGNIPHLWAIPGALESTINKDGDHLEVPNHYTSPLSELPIEAFFVGQARHDV